MVIARLQAAAAVAALALLGACAAMIEEAQRGAAAPVAPLAVPVDLISQWSLNGVRLAQPAGALGAPMPGTAGGLLTFMRPTAIAARDTDVVVVDAGRNALLRVDPFTQTATALPTANISLLGPVQMALRANRSLLLIDTARIVHWLDANGRPLPGFAVPAPDLGQAVDVLDDTVRARVWVADGLYRQVLEFAPAARAWRVVTPIDEAGPAFGAVAALAADERGLYVADPACHCIVLMHTSGRVLGRFGAGELTQPTALAADGSGRLFVADAGTRQLRLFVDGKLTQSFSYRSLGISEITDLVIDSGAVYIAAAVDGRVLALRIVSRAARVP